MSLAAGLALTLALPAATPLPSDAVPTIKPVAHKGYSETIPGSKVRFQMVAIPGGTFRMGSPVNEAGRNPDEGPQHSVTIRPFWMGMMEITWDEYDLFRKDGPASQGENEEAVANKADAITRPTVPYPDETRGYGRDGYPAIGVSHHAAMEYCRWLSGQTGKAYRLPTEAEWEWACRAGTWTVYSFGDNPADLGAHAWTAANSKESTHFVGQKKPNPWGLHDMHGNVAEWCLDQYQKDWYGTLPLDRPALAPVKLPGADRFPHVVRGGSWADAAGRCRSAARRASDPSWNQLDPELPRSVWWLWNADFVGFRVVRAVEEQDELRAIRSKVTMNSK